MNAIETPEAPGQLDQATEAERAELEWLLTSGALGRSGNLARIVRYICEERFAGRGHLLKEYTIATEALGRRPGFDPHVDTIVRVTVHSLRKRLTELYLNEGIDRPLRLIVPPGRYEPTFQPRQSPQQSVPEPARDPEQISPPPAPAAEVPPAIPRTNRLFLWAPLFLTILALAGWTAWSRRHRNPHPPAIAAAHPIRQDSIHALLGTGRQPYVDHSGQRWSTENYCQGESISVPARRIEGTQDPALYLGGVRGMAHCLFPVTQSLYEIHFHFAEASDLQAATRVASLSINAGPAFGIDVVDNAGGDGIATTSVVTGVAPENDGSIHVDFISEVSSLDAVEILPAPSPSLLPVRIVMSPEPYTDDLHQVWSADRYFSGGRHGQLPGSGDRARLGLYQSERIGRFRYVIPAVPRAHYRVLLHFREPWFGPGNGGDGGPGSRVFDVAANGQMLLKDFDILNQAGTGPLVKTFHVQASAAGRIELAFMPQTNYALVNAIEVLPED